MWHVARYAHRLAACSAKQCVDMLNQCNGTGTHTGQVFKHCVKDFTVYVQKYVCQTAVSLNASFHMFTSRSHGCCQASVLFKLCLVCLVLQVRHYLIEDWRPALEAVTRGFHTLDLTDHLEHFSGVELAALFCGEQYVDVDALIRFFKFEGEQQATADARNWLEAFVRSLSESSIRIFLARVTNQLSLPRPGQHITVELMPDQEQPMLSPVACHMQLPCCTSYEREIAWLWLCTLGTTSRVQMLNRISV